MRIVLLLFFYDRTTWPDWIYKNFQESRNAVPQSILKISIFGLLIPFNIHIMNINVFNRLATPAIVLRIHLKINI